MSEKISEYDLEQMYQEMEKISEYDLEKMYQEMLDDCYGTVEVAGMTYDTSRVLKDCDPIAYRVGMTDYADSLMEDGYRVEGYE